MSRGPWSPESRARHSAVFHVSDFSEQHREASQEGAAAGMKRTPAIALEDELQRSWRRLVAEVKASHDLDALNALKGFQLNLEAFLHRATG